MNDDQKKEQEIDAAWSQHRDPGRFISVIRREWLERHLALQDDLCAYCGVTMLPMSVKGKEHIRATVDHIVPRSKGGPDEILNTLAACQRCNSAKDDLSVEEFVVSSELYDLAKVATNGPDRLSGHPDSPYYDRFRMGRGIEVQLSGKSRGNIVEYCVSGGWIRSRVPKSRDRNGNRMTFKFHGEVVALCRDNLVRVATIEDGTFAAAFDEWLKSRSFDTGESKDYLRRD